MRSRRNDDLSSFELLLDTMCNTFGGILFIALLLILLSQSIEIKSSTQTNQPISSTYKIQQLTSKVKANIELIKLIKQNIKSIEEEIKTLNQQISQSEKLQTKSRELRLPKLHQIDKLPVFAALRYGRFYAITNISYSLINKWGSNGRGYDNSDIFINEYNNITTIELLSGRGQIIKQGAENSGKIQQAIININPQKEFINFAVYPDSFAEFNYLKELFINKGFDYNWFIIKNQLSLVKGVGQIDVQ